MKLDLLDSKILAELDKNSRSSESAISKAVGTSKQVVRYRIQRLIERKIIESFYTMIDVGPLGFDSYYIFLQFSGLDSKKEEEIINRILKLNYITWVVTGVGRWDCVLLISARNISEFNKYLEEVQSIVGNNLHEHTFVTLIKAEHISYKFIQPKPSSELITTRSNTSIQLSDDEKIILKIINQQARLPVTEISKLTNIPTHTVHYKLKQLQKLNIIQGFRPKINIHKLDFEWHLLLIQFNLTNEERKRTFFEYCRQRENIYYVSNTVGEYNILMDIHVKNAQEYRDVLFDLKSKFSDLIKLYESIVVFDEKLITYIPEVIFK